VIDLYETAHKVGMESGDFEGGLMSQVTQYVYCFLAGHPLADLEMKYLSVINKLRLYNIKFFLGGAGEQLLLIQYLRGTAERDFDPTLLADFGSEGTGHDVSEHFRLMFGYCTRLQLGVYFNDDDLAHQSVKRLDLESTSSDTSFDLLTVRLCFISLACSTLYRNRRKRSYLTKSKRCLGQLQRICRIRGAESLHRCMLMEAHLEAAKGKYLPSIPLAFDRAIEAASRTGYDRDAALGSQLAAEYCLSIMQGIQKDSIHFTTMDTLLRRYLQQAIDLYKSWGAIAVVNHSETKHSSFLNDTTIRDS